jgi:WD40 repeat protein
MFLPHVSAWEVADVQWSPHPSRAHWISSAAGGSALIWNLNLRGSRSPIEYTLTGHTRTVTDINFSVFELDAIATCSLDGQILTWDLRAAGRRPSSGFLSCNIAATQVKYSRQNPCLIASAHDTVVNLWDLRKASSPILAINAHQQRCYGLDFDRRSADRFVTCSLDSEFILPSRRLPHFDIHYQEPSKWVRLVVALSR